MLEREQRLLADTLTEATLAVASLTSHQAVLDEILVQADRIVPCAAANIALVEGDLLRSVAVRGYDAHGGGEFVSGFVAPLTDHPIDAASVHTREPLVVPDTGQDPRWLVFPEIAWIRSYLVAPICLQNHVLGLLRLDGDSPGSFSAEDAERLLPLANVAAVALEHARLYEATLRELGERELVEEERERLFVLEREQRLLADTLTEATFAVSSWTSHQAVLDEILVQADRIVPHDSANIALLQGDLLRNVRARGYDAHGSGEFASSLAVPLSDLPIAVAAVQTRKPLIIPDTRKDPRWVVFPETAWIRSCLVAPICLQDRVLGMLRLDGDSPNRFSAEDAERILPLTNVAAVALENARLYEATLRELGERQAAEEQIKASLREKEILLKEIHHRVGNNLQIISSLLSMQSRVIEDETAVAAFQASQDRVRSMARIHQRLYRSRDLTQIEMQEYLQQLVADLWMTYAPQGITARIEAAGVALDSDKAIPCALLLNELVSNALKHAFPAPGSGQANEIRISMRRERESIELMVSDTGVGLPADLDLENLDSLGLDLVRLLAGQIGGILQLDRSSGASFKITFPQP